MKIANRKLAKVIRKVTSHSKHISQASIKDFVLADWDEGQEHQDWLNSAAPEEIADWVIAGLR